jgi:hypothetical protein
VRVIILEKPRTDKIAHPGGTRRFAILAAIPTPRNMKASSKGRPRLIGSISEFLEKVSGVLQKWFNGDRFWQPWFSGLGDINWKLQPRLYRVNRDINQLLPVTVVFG